MVPGRKPPSVVKIILASISSLKVNTGVGAPRQKAPIANFRNTVDRVTTIDYLLAILIALLISTKTFKVQL